MKSVENFNISAVNAAVTETPSQVVNRLAENPLQNPTLIFIGSEASILHGDLYALRKVSTVIPVSACKDYSMTVDEMIKNQRAHGMKLFMTCSFELATLLTFSSPEVVAKRLSEIK